MGIKLSGGQPIMLSSRPASTAKGFVDKEDTAKNGNKLFQFRVNSGSPSVAALELAPSLRLFDFPPVHILYLQ
jgi:hypothetical protein